MSYTSFLEEVYATGEPRETKADIVEYYTDKYGWPGGKSHLINDLLDRVYDVTPGSVGKEEYKRQYKNLSKRFDPQRLNNPEARNASQYKALGETLPPIPPDARGHIYGVIWVKYSDDCEDRDVDIELSAEDVITFFEMSAKDMVQAAANGYQSNQPGDTDLDFKGPEPCQEPDIHFELIE